MRRAALAALAIVAGCASADSPARIAALSAIPGRALGPEQSCINRRDVGRVESVNDYVAFFHMHGGKIYRSDLPGRCPGLGRYTIVHSSAVDQYCRNEAIQLVELTAPSEHGSCVLGGYVPWALPKDGPEG